MSDLAALAFALIVICVAVYTVARYAERRSGAASRIARMAWQLEEHGDGDNWNLFALRPGTAERRCLATIPWADPDFDNKIEEARVEGQLKVQTLNRGLPR